MLQLIALLIFLFSFLVVMFMLLKKAPVLANLPKNGSMGIKKPALAAKAEARIKDLHFHFFSKQMLLHKLLSWVKVWTLKAETRIDQLLHGIRKNAQELDKKVRRKK